MPRTRIPTEEDFTSLTTSSSSQNSTNNNNLHIKLVYPSPRESTTAIMIFFHGLGDNEDSFASFARNLNLPGVLNISVRGTSPLPTGLFSDELPRHFHWGDDLRLDSGDLDQDPGFEKARDLIMRRLIGEVLIGKCGWEMEDILLFGFGQGGALALGLASALRGGGQRIQEITDTKEEEEAAGKEKAFKGVVSIGGALPASMVPTVSGRGKARTSVLICHGRESEVVDEDAVELLRQEFEKVKVVEWKRDDDGMPRNREEVLPMMQFFAERLRSGWS
ncbi:Alpha/Beta hydrolase fold [Naviculisporaceae sp. PSN 640]